MKFRFRGPMLGNLMAPKEPFVTTLPTYLGKDRNPFSQPGKNGISLPSCFYMPNPTYTDEAREQKTLAVILVEATVAPEGHLEDFRLFRGAPHGLSQSAISTMNSWGCKPSMHDGLPIPTRVTFEVNFRWY
jgi:TonB family protein